MKYVIGLTGLLGSGKSSVAHYFENLNICVIDTDLIAHQITMPFGAAISDIRVNFGDEFVDEFGALDRAKMRNLVFTQPKMRLKLETILHPLILNRVINLIHTATSDYVIVVVPLLFKSLKYLKLVQQSIFVNCENQLLIKRVILRSNLGVKEIQDILATQPPLELQLRLADDICSNTNIFFFLFI